MARVAIEIDNDRIFLAAAKMASRRSKLTQATVIESSANVTELTEALRDKVNSTGLAKAETSVVIGRCGVEMRIMNVPPAPDSELPGLVKFLSKNEFASLNENWPLDFVRLSGNADTPGRVLAAGISPDTHKRLKTIVTDSGLRLRDIQFRPFAVSKYLHDKVDTSGTRIVVEPQRENVEITLFQNSSIIGVRKFKATGDLIKLVAREIKRTLAAEHDALKNAPLSNVILLGQSDQLKPIGTALTGSLATDYQIVDAAADLQHGNLIKTVPEETRFAALIGALVDNESLEDLDFLNPRQPTVEKQDYSKWRLYGAIAAGILALMFGFGWWTLSDQKNEIIQRQETLAKITANNQGDSNRPATADTLSEVGKIDQWMAGRTNWQDTLLEYSQHALTADDAIVDRLQGRVKTNASSVSMLIKNRAADNAAEAALIRQLSEAFDVTSGKSEVVDDDFEAHSDFTVAKTWTTDEKIKQLDKLAEAYLDSLRQRNSARATNQPSNQAIN